MSVPALGSKNYKNGDKIAQLIIMKLPWVDIEEVDELSETDRGEGGFGSTGN
jgi:dUTP pyrophosphatase